MTPLCQEMLTTAALRGLQPSTAHRYVLHVRVLVRYHERSPDELGRKDVRTFLLHIQELGRSPSTVRAHRAALLFLYVQVLDRPEVLVGIPAPRVRRRPPVAALTRAEVQALLDAANRPFDRTFYAVTYACGLRVSETRAIGVGDIDARAGLIHIRHGKGDKARSAPLSRATLGLLRDPWRRYRPPQPWLFPARRLASPGVVDAEHPWSAPPRLQQDDGAPLPKDGRARSSAAQRDPPRPQAGLRHASAGERRGPTGHPGPPRARTSRDNGSVHRSEREAAPADALPPRSARRTALKVCNRGCFNALRDGQPHETLASALDRLLSLAEVSMPSVTGSLMRPRRSHDGQRPKRQFQCPT